MKKRSFELALGGGHARGVIAIATNKRSELNLDQTRSGNRFVPTICTDYRLLSPQGADN
ncbi:MAG: hypothetical protein WBM86_29765 [Waterburya sp.]